MTIATWLLIAALTASLLRAHHRLVLVARASHELRGPLSAAQLGLHGLKGEPARLAAVELELRRAGRALEDLAAARVGRRARGGAERVDLAQLVRDHEPAWRTLAALHGAPVRVAPPIVVLPFAAGGGDTSAPLIVFADPLRIAQACANLVANAAEHGRGEIRVRVRAAAGQVAIEVADEGSGLPAPLAAMIAPARLRRGRRGHGLAIAASIASHSGGRLSADGPRLTLELPAAGTPVARTRRARATAALRRRLAPVARRRAATGDAADEGGIAAPGLAASGLAASGLAAPDRAAADRTAPGLAAPGLAAPGLAADRGRPAGPAPGGPDGDDSARDRSVAS